ncbi:acetyl/propionyl/methylcrotonyl-CoA carboxylase subunit alpha [Pseudomonas japonica]|uniref:acetyl/propionyl/methylcrotonyl-CoA carboxylase subunit alpha n=1 Tax=Pseudomonas japonica TaxID=256466 RepID=UPI0015E2F8A4|nr:acetyl/propionyl/methylcrotonyl-CoA carboxylase subunit alpha [Pseudomonas japonica]MBA1242264.1 acetyl/propionyl/methylcrotonyl-CoA carboxylase subunit alpha [Pseudomonas japonica]
MSTLDRLLIANRGEIACRIMRTAQALGIECVAVYSDADRRARHVREADVAIALGGTKPAESYLNIDKVIAAAKASGARAVHPGYGFLSENATFARELEEAGLIFIGPPASAIDAMGSKAAAKALMEIAQVPLVPGYHGEDQRYETFRAAAERIGYPVLLKPSAGGGGKGMKVVENEAGLADGIESAQREARSSFGDARLLVEKYVLSPRHVEIQVFADQHGHCVYLHERDCSIQRRHQKVIEEAPAPGLTAELRQAMGEAAVRAAQAIGYVGAGTVEFLLDARGTFYFMEMNTRLQVEHPVTEAITGLDLVAWQLRVARGEPLPLTQDQVPLRGHAIEARLYAEDPDTGFLPASGRLSVYEEPAAGIGRRVDSGVQEGDDISPFYDPMLAKLIAWGETREDARLRLIAMLAETTVAGVKTNRHFLQRLLGHGDFADARLDTGFIGRHEAALLPPAEPLDDAFWQQAARLYLATSEKQTEPSPWAAPSGWRHARPAEAVLSLQCGEQQRLVTFDPAEPQAFAMAGVRRASALHVQWQGAQYEVHAVDPLAQSNAAHAAPGSLAAPMNASVVSVLVTVGDHVAAGASLVVLEAMKMEHTLRAPRSGLVTAINCAAGDLVNEGAVLVAVEEVDNAA